MPCIIYPLLFFTLAYSFDVLAIEGTSQPEAIIYYSNETVSESLSSKNYQTFLRILDRSATDSAMEIRDALLHDVSNGVRTSLRDVDALRAVARRASVRLIVFSNALALRNQFQFYDPASAKLITANLPLMSANNGPLLSLSPLSRAEQLRAALDLALERLGGSAAIALIVNSHGTIGIPLMPRVNFDFTQVSEDDILRVLNDVSHNDLQLPYVKLQGTSQVEFWRILDDLSKAHRTTFPIVFLSSCESGPLTVSEVLAIPSSVKLILHSGRNGMSPAAISYEAIFSPLSRQGIGINGISSALESGLLEAGQDLQSDTALTAWRWPLISYLTNVPLWVFGVPLMIWMVWQALTFAVQKRGHGSVRVEHDC